MTLNKKIGTRIKLARVRTGLTQKQLGEQLGKSGAAIAYLEQGKRRISPDILDDIARITQKPLAFFYEQQDDVSAPLDSQISDLRAELEQVKKVLELQYSASDKFCSVFEHAVDGMVLMDLDGTVLDINRRYEGIMGWQRAEVQGKPFWEFDFFPAQKMPQLKRLFSSSIEQEKLHEKVRMVMSTKQGRELEVDIWSTLLYRDNRPWAMLSSVRPLGEEGVAIDEILPSMEV